MSLPADDEFELLAHIDVMDRLVERAAPPAQLRDALLDSLSPAPTFLGYAKRVARVFDLDVARVQEALLAMSDRSQWVDVQGGGKFFPLTGGPRVQGAQMGFVEFRAGSLFPRHRHQGLEVQFVITGRLIETDGREFLPGDLLVKESGTEHEFSIGAESSCVCAVVLYEGIDFV